MSTLEVAGLSKSYGMKRVVNELSFIVRPGTVTGFLGPNGAGKTTTLRMLLGLTRPDSGSALVAGRPFHEHPEPMKTVGSLMDARWMHPKRSARAHLAWLARASRLPRSRVEEVLAQVGLSQVADKRVGTFSLGMSQRVGFAAALLGDPAILVLGEPANGLDPEGIAWMRGLLRTMAERGHTILVSSHLLAEMAQLADELIVIGRGRLLRQCAVAELTSETSAGQVMVRTPDAERLRPLVAAAGGMFAADSQGIRESDTYLVTGLSCEEIGSAAAATGIVLYELTPRRHTVEDAYLQLTSESVEYQGACGLPRVTEGNAV